VITEFLVSWPLFHNAYLAGWLIGILLSLIGVLVVVRDQIFIGAAVSQAATLGVAMGMVIGSLFTNDEQSWVRSHIFHDVMGGLLAVLAALFTTRGSTTAGRESHEAITGWVFLVSVSGAVLLLSHSPHGLDEVNHILSSTIVGATSSDVWLFVALTVSTAGALALWYRPTLLVVLDPEMARAVGVPVAGGMPRSQFGSESQSGFRSTSRVLSMLLPTWSFPRWLQKISDARFARCSSSPLWFPSGQE